MYLNAIHCMLLVVWLQFVLELDIVSGWLLVTHTYLYNFASSLSLSHGKHQHES